MRKNYLLALIMLLILLKPAWAVDEEEYVVGPGDCLDITVWNESSLTKVFTISRKGNLDLPILGEIKVTGLGTKQIAELITQKLKEGQYILDPKVNVLVNKYASQKVMVFGLANKLGIYYLRGKTTVLELISELGGIPPTAGSMIIHRKSQVAKAEKGQNEDNLITVDLQALLVQGDLSCDIPILGGDLIYVGETTKHTIYILGEVKKPGPYPFYKGITILKAIEMAGSFTEYASQNRIKIVREEQGGQKKNIFVRMGDIQKGHIEKDIELQKGDVVVVPQSWF